MRSPCFQCVGINTYTPIGTVEFRERLQPKPPTRTDTPLLPGELHPAIPLLPAPRTTLLSSRRRWSGLKPCSRDSLRCNRHIKHRRHNNRHHSQHRRHSRLHRRSLSRLQLQPSPRSPL